MDVYERLCSIQAAAQAIHHEGIRYTNVSDDDVLWLCAELRTAWRDTERARATAAGLALEPSAYDIGDDA